MYYSHCISIVRTLKEKWKFVWNFKLCHFLVPFILLFYFVSQKHINKLSCTVKQISVCYIHAVTVAVLYCCCTLNYINIFYYNFAPDGWKVTWPAVWPTVLLSQFCTPTVTAHRHCIIRCTADRVTTSWLMLSYLKLF